MRGKSRFLSQFFIYEQFFPLECNSYLIRKGKIWTSDISYQ